MFTFTGIRTGVLTGMFLFLHAFLRIFVDVFREYPTTLLGLTTGQILNILVAILGLVLIPVGSRHRPVEAPVARAGITEEHPMSAGVGWRRLVFALLLLFALVLPSDWTQDVLARYGTRHAGLAHSTLYPRIDTVAPNTHPGVHSQNAPNQHIPPTR